MNPETIALKARIEIQRELDIKVSGGCMEPLLRPGDSMKVVEAKSFHIGEICLFEMPGEGLAMHRIIAMTPGMVVMKGDCSSRHEVIPLYAIVGVACFVKPIGHEEWNDISTGVVLGHAAVFLSKRIYHDRSIVRGATAERVKRTKRHVCKWLLSSWNRRVRDGWING